MNETMNGEGKKPLALYAILERNGKTVWLKVGAAFPNRDGSIAVLLDAYPAGAHRLQIREQREWERNGAGEGGGGRAESAAAP